MVPPLGLHVAPHTKESPMSERTFFQRLDEALFSPQDEDEDDNSDEDINVPFSLDL
jgi:hypothetical protein